MSEKAGGGDQGFRDEVAAAATSTHKAFDNGDAGLGGSAPTYGWLGHMSGMCFLFFIFF